MKGFIGKTAAVIAALTGFMLTAGAQTPTITGFSIENSNKDQAALTSGDRFYQFKGDSFRVEYSQPVDKTAWTIEQDGKEVLSGTADGSADGNYTAVALKDAVNNALMDKTLLPGIATFKVKEATYGGNVAKDLASIDLDFTDVPFITMFFPGKNEESPLELRSGQTVYVYFQTGARIMSARGRIVQDGNDLGEVVFDGIQTAGRWGNTPRLSYNETNTPVFDKIKHGAFSVEVTDVEFISPYDEQEHSVTCGAKPFDSVTYVRKIEGKLVSEEGLPDGKMLSWYAPDSADGIIKYTFSLPIDISNAHCYLEYGLGETRQATPLKFSLSEDGYSVIVDLRGELHDTATLAQGHTYVDDDGNVVIPTTVNLLLEKIVSANGELITSTVLNPVTGKEYTLTGQVFRNYEIVDLTFPTPQITKVEFYASSDPSERLMNMSEDTDMMDIFISDSKYIASASVKLRNGDAVAVIPNADIVKGKDVYSLPIPASIKALGSDDLVISIVDAVFTEEDGAVHEIRPYAFSDIAKEIANISTLKMMEEGLDAILNVKEGVKVTMADSGYCFIEDDTAAIQVVTADGAIPFEKGSLLVGKIAGKVYGGSVFQIDIEGSEYSIGTANVTFGKKVDSLADLSDDDNCRLLTFSAAKHKLAYDASQRVIVIDEATAAITDFLPEGFEMPARINDVSGIYYVMPGQEPILIIRDEFDINNLEEETPVECLTIADLKSMGEDADVYLTLEEATVTFVADGVAFIEDATGAIMVCPDDEDALLPEAGMVVSCRSLEGVYSNGGFVYFNGGFDVVGTGDVAEGINIPVADAFKAENEYRLVTFVRSADTAIVSDGFGLQVGENLFVVDYFGVLPDDYEFPAEVTKVTGLLIPNFASVFDDDDAEVGFDDPKVFLAVRSTADIVGTATGIEEVGETADAGAVYNLFGVKVSDDNLVTLPRGLYIQNGRKVLHR